MGSTPLKQISKGVDVRWGRPGGCVITDREASVCSAHRLRDLKRNKHVWLLLSQIENIPLPEGYTLCWQGEKIASTDSMKYLFKNFPLAIILMIAILIMLFKDYRKPIIIFCCIPLVFVGSGGSHAAHWKDFQFCCDSGDAGIDRYVD